MKASALFALCALPAWAEESSPFVEANLLSVFYHELGHAVIDIEALPVFAQEEDAADVFSILLIDALYEADAAEDIAYHAAGGFWAEALETGDELALWDVHSPDERRFYNTVCLFYGAEPDLRQDFAQELGLPEERAETCSEEFELANDSWGPVLDDMAARGGGKTFRLSGDLESITGRLLVGEIDALNAEFTLAAPLNIVIEPCAEANAFYDPSDAKIIMCTEYEAHLQKLEARLSE